MITNIVSFFKKYSLNDLKDDLTAGLTVGAVALPQNMAYALIIGLNPIYGIYTSIVSMIVAAFVGSSNYLVVGPTNVMALAISSTLSPYKGEHYLEFILLLTFLIGAFQLIMAFMRLGKLVNYISQPVIVGLTTGIALIIGVGQLSNFFGLNIESGFNFFDTLYKFFINIGEINYHALFIGLITIGIIVFLKNYKPDLPAYLISIITIISITYIFGLNDHFEVINNFNSSLPQFQLFNFELSRVKNLLSSALSLAIFGFIQVASIDKSLEDLSKENVDMNQEFIGQGIINIVCSFFSSFAITGSFTNSFINYETGAKTRISEFMTALFFILFLLLLAPLVQFIPVASLAAVVIFVALGMIDIDKITRTFKTTGFDAVILTVTFLTTLILPRLDYAIYFGVLISIILVLKNTSSVEYSHIDYQFEEKDKFSHKKIHDVKENNCIIINISGNVHFNSADNLKEKLDNSFIEDTDFVIRMRDIENIDITSLNELEKFIDRVHNNGGRVLFSGINEKLYKYLQKSGILDKVDKNDIFQANEYIFSSTKEAVNEAEEENGKKFRND